MDLTNLRRDYGEKPLQQGDLSADPVEQFNSWYNQATEAGVAEPNAMTLSTVSASGTPAGRIVLLKAVVDQRFVFFTDYRSQKGQDLAGNPAAALTFWWPPISRQVRITGRVSRSSAEESDDYYLTRPEGSRVGAWASRQSSPLDDRAQLEAEVLSVTERFKGAEIPRPSHWGGFRLDPDSIEFWQGRTDRLHDRFVYTRNPDSESAWHCARLSP